MFEYAKSYNESKEQLFEKIDDLKKDGYHIFTSKKSIIDDLSIDKVIIKSKKETKNRLVFSLGLHGIEGYVGHSCVMTFLDEILKDINEETEVIIYHPLNPFGMNHYRRTNENNVDLNRNFSNNNFTSENIGFKRAEDFFLPKEYKGIKSGNLSYYSNLVKLIGKYGVTTLKEATLLGQKSAKDAIYYSGLEYQTSTKYVLEEAKKNVSNIEKVIWIDLHTGYGQRYQMSVVNSKYETESTELFIENINYPLVLGLNTEDFYNIDGDMIEKIYSIHHKNKEKSDLLVTCFEFGTLGETLRKTIESLKAMIFENSSYFANQKDKFSKYSSILIREQFLPSEIAWRKKAYKDFKQAIYGILRFKNLSK